MGYYLRATVSYDDGEGDGKSARATSANEVQSINSPNDTPAFLDQDPDTAGIQNDAATRTIGENADAGANVGAPVAAEDDDSDILTYTLDGDRCAPPSRSTQRPDRSRSVLSWTSRPYDPATRSWSRPRTRPD